MIERSQKRREHNAHLSAGVTQSTTVDKCGAGILSLCGTLCVSTTKAPPVCPIIPSKSSGNMLLRTVSLAPWVPDGDCIVYIHLNEMSSTHAMAGRGQVSIIHRHRLNVLFNLRYNLSEAVRTSEVSRMMYRQCHAFLRRKSRIWYLIPSIGSHSFVFIALVSNCSSAMRT